MSINNITFFDINKSFVEELSSLNKYGIKSVHGNIIDIVKTNKIDALVSPANSYGFMNGGIDKVYTRIFPDIQNKVQTRIKEINILDPSYRPYIPVGSAITISTDARIPYLLVVPTMTMPSVIKNVSDIYFSFIAILYISLNNPMLQIWVPSLGTGVGNMSIVESVNQIERAINSFSKLMHDQTYSRYIRYQDKLNIIL